MTGWIVAGLLLLAGLAMSMKIEQLQEELRQRGDEDTT